MVFGMFFLRHSVFVVVL